MVDCLLVTDSFVYRFLWMSSANEVEQLRPDWLTGDELGGEEGPRVFNILAEEPKRISPRFSPPIPRFYNV